MEVDCDTEVSKGELFALETVERWNRKEEQEVWYDTSYRDKDMCSTLFKKSRTNLKIK